MIMHPKYFTQNIGNSLFSQYELINLLVFFNHSDKIEESSCSSYLINLCKKHEKYITKTISGMFLWKKTIYEINTDGRKVVSFHKNKVDSINLLLKKEMSDFSDEYTGINLFMEKLELIARKKFKSFADFVIQKDILSGSFKKFHKCFHTLNMFNSVYKNIKLKIYSKKIKDIDFSIFDSYGNSNIFFLISFLIDENNDVFDYYFNPRENIKTPVADAVETKANISIKFSDE